MAKKEKDIFDEENAVQSNWFKANVPLEDKVAGTLIAKRTMKSTLPGADGKMVNIYEIKASEGTWHVLDEKKRLVEEPVVVEPGAFVSVGGNAVIDRQMQNVRVGQIIGIKYLEERPSKTKGFAPAKISKIFVMKNDDGTPKMDEEVLAEQNTVDGF